MRVEGEALEVVDGEALGGSLLEAEVLAGALRIVWYRDRREEVEVNRAGSSAVAGAFAVLGMLLPVCSAQTAPSTSHGRNYEEAQVGSCCNLSHAARDPDAPSLPSVAAGSGKRRIPGLTVASPLEGPRSAARRCFSGTFR